MNIVEVQFHADFVEKDTEELLDTLLGLWRQHCHFI
jgi:hypothetical protein